MSELPKSSAAVPEEPKPSPLLSTGHPTKPQTVSCIQTLERLIMKDTWMHQSMDDSFSSDRSETVEGENVEEPVVPVKKVNVTPQLDELTHSILTGYGLKAYIRLLNVDHGRAVAERLYNETDVALRKLCDYGDGALRFDDDVYEACVKIARLAVTRRIISNQQLQHAYAEGSPSTDAETRRVTEYVAYLSPCVPYPDLAKTITTETCIQFVHTVPAARFISKKDSTPNATGSVMDGRLDVDALEASLKADVEGRTGRQTVLVIAVVGSAVFGHNDMITKLLHLRQTYGFWLHLVGLNAAALAASKPPEHLLRALKSADSVTLPLGRWLGIRSLPLITYVRMVDYGSSLYQREKLDCLPWWIVLNHLTIDGVRKRIDTAFRVSGGILKQLLSHSAIILPGLGPSPDLLSRIEKGTLMPPTVLTFKYTIARPVTNVETGEVTEEIVNDEYLDSLNVWLSQGLATSCPSLGLQLVDLSQSQLGAAIRFCPLEQHAATIVNPSDYVNHFGEKFRSTLGILDATVHARDRLENTLTTKYPELQLVHLKKWAGVGGLIYLPSMFRPASLVSDSENNGEGQNDSVSSIPEWNEEQRRQISHFNIEIVHNLRGSDCAFSVGNSLEDISCIKFGMLSDDRDLDELLDVVVNVGREIEESSQYVDTLAELVRRGIEAANEGLRKENDERLMQEGVLRQVPLVGSLMNWWSPLPKDSSARGRAFDLKTGCILPTAELLSKRQSSVTDSSPSLTPHLSANSTPSAAVHDKTSSEVETPEKA